MWKIKHRGPQLDIGGPYRHIFLKFGNLAPAEAAAGFRRFGGQQMRIIRFPDGRVILLPERKWPSEAVGGYAVAILLTIAALVIATVAA